MIVKVRDKEFKIELVSNYVLELYEELTNLASIQGASYAIEIENLQLEQEEEEEKATTRKEKREINGRYKKLFLDKYEEFKQLKNQMLELRQSIIQEILESNEYEYDETWWMKRASAEDNNDFMKMCVTKDYESDGSTVSKKK